MVTAVGNINRLVLKSVIGILSVGEDLTEPLGCSRKCKNIIVVWSLLCREIAFLYRFMTVRLIDSFG